MSYAPRMLPTSDQLQTGRQEFIFVGDHPSIDFVNTYVMANGQEIDLLRTWMDLIDWLSRTGLSVNPGLKLPAARSRGALKSVVGLRQAWNTELARLVSGGKISDEFIERLNHLLVDATFHEELCRVRQNDFHLVRSNFQLHGEKLALSILGRQIALFLAEANISYLRRCANTTSCILYFYDTTKNHRRRWCSVTGCGNRHKVAAFRQRQVGGKGGMR